MAFKQRGCLEFEIPKTCIVSEGDQLIKELIDKQLNKNIHLQDELTRINQFGKPTELINETELLVGTSSLNEFKNQAEHLKHIDALKSAGLTDTEIELYLEFNQNGKEYVLNKHRNICSAICTEYLESIKHKLQIKDESELKDTNNTLVSRHLKELGLSTKPDSLETRLYKFATSRSSKNVKDNTPAAHPINKLAEIEKDLFSHLNNPQVPSLKKRRKKAKKYLDCSDDANHTKSISPKLTTKWDVPYADVPESSVKNTNKLYTCSSKRKYTIKNNEIVEISSSKNCKDVADVKSKGQIFISGKVNEEYCSTGKKLTEHEIQKITKFQNYEKGIPSKILFLKNLAKQTNEKDLINLFNRFDNNCNKITYRLLTGKMRGQAFVTFNNIKQATAALESLNGIVLKNKPLIIQYGKTNTVSTN